MQTIADTLAAFMNTESGMLFVGITDEKRISGIERDSDILAPSNGRISFISYLLSVICHNVPDALPASPDYGEGAFGAVGALCARCRRGALSAQGARLGFGADAHGANAEWYGAVCPNVFMKASPGEPTGSAVTLPNGETVHIRPDVRYLR